jgi:HlyD family secretion protein
MPRLKATGACDWPRKAFSPQEDVDTAEATFHTAAADQDAFTAQQRAAEDNGKVAQADLKVRHSIDGQPGAGEAVRGGASIRPDRLGVYLYQGPGRWRSGVAKRRCGPDRGASLSAPTLFQIAQDLTKMQVDTNVPEADVGRVQVGQPATFTVDAYPRRVFTGTVTSIRKAPINVQNVITYDAVVGVSNTDLKLFPGMTANVKILVDQRPNVLSVLSAALRYRPASETQAPAASGKGTGKGATPEQAVSVMDPNNKQRRVTITTGQSDGTYTEVIGGDLKDGDRVVVAELVNAGAASNSAAASARSGRGTGF